MGFVPQPTYLTLPRAPEAWIVEDILPTGGLLNIYGRPKEGKSFLATQLAAAIADPSQDSFMSFPIRTHGRVAYLQVDTPRAIWAQNIGTCFQGFDLSQFYIADSQMVPYPFNILAEGHTWLRAACNELEPVVVIIDTLREIHGGEENDSGHMRNVVNLLVEATRPAAVVLISHARKNLPEGEMDLMAENRGSSYIAGRMDAIIKVTEKRLTYRSRTTGEDSLAVRRLPENGRFELADAIQEEAKRLLRQFDGTNLSSLARRLQERFPQQSLEACRSRLRRLL